MAVFKSERFAVDLTTIEKPFGMLDAETQRALLREYRAGAPMQVYRGSRGWIEKQRGGDLFGDWTYRARPTPKPPAIELPWEVIDPRWKWVAMDGDKTLHLYTHEIEATKTHWVLIEEGDYRQIDDLFTGIRINVTDWRESLTRRPE